MQENHVNNTPVYLGGAGEENVTACIRVCSINPSKDIESSRNIHEEADDRMMYNIHQAVTTESIERVIIASGDTDVFVCSIYHYSRWVYRGLKEFRIVSGNSNTKTVLSNNNNINNNNKMLITFFKPFLLLRRTMILLALSLYQVHQIRKLRTLNTQKLLLKLLKDIGLLICQF